MRNRASVLSHLAPPATMPATTPAPIPSTDPIPIQELVLAMRNDASPAPLVPSSTTTNMDKHWPTGLNTLLKFAHSSSVADLPKVWQSIAAGPRKSERAIIQSAIDEYARSPAAATAVTLVVNKDLVESIVNFRLWSGDIDRLDEGIHPFTLSTLALHKVPRISHIFKRMTLLSQMAPCALQIFTFLVMS